MNTHARGRLASWTFVVLAFAASRIVARGVLGMHFDWSSITFYLQYPTISMMRDDLLRTVFYMHHQAPLPSLLVGVAMKLAPVEYLTLLDAFHVGLGLVIALGMVEILARLGVSTLVRTVVVAIYTASPPVILYEMWLFYHQLVVALLIVALLAALRYAERPTVGRGLQLFFGLAAVAYSRSIYGAVWVGAGIVIALVAIPSARRRTLLTAAIPFVLAIAIPIKTKLTTGGGYGDAILWPNLSTKVLYALPHHVRDKLVRDGTISKVAQIEAFSRLDLFERTAGEPLAWPPYGVPVLDDREHGGQLNKQHAGYLEIAARWSKPDALVLLRRYPEAYLKASVTALTVNSMRPSLEDLSISRSPNFHHMRGPDQAMRKVLRIDKKGRIVTLMYLAPLAVAYGIWTFLRRSAGAPSQRGIRIAIALATMTIGYTSLGTAFISYGDFSRYRFEVDAFYMIIWTVMACRLGSALRRVWSEQMSRRRARRAALAAAT